MFFVWFVVYKMIEILYKSICVVLHHVWKAQWLRVTRFSQIVACLPFVTEWSDWMSDRKLWHCLATLLRKWECERRRFFLVTTVILTQKVRGWHLWEQCRRWSFVSGGFNDITWFYWLYSCYNWLTLSYPDLKGFKGLSIKSKWSQSCVMVNWATWRTCCRR